MSPSWFHPGSPPPKASSPPRATSPTSAESLQVQTWVERSAPPEPQVQTWVERSASPRPQAHTWVERGSPHTVVQPTGWGEVNKPFVPQDASWDDNPPAADGLAAVKQLCGMGFGRKQAVEALEKHDYNFAEALDSLLPEVDELYVTPKPYTAVQPRYWYEVDKLEDDRLLRMGCVSSRQVD